MCPTAGLLGNDNVELEATVRTGAALTLSNPSSLRIHKMDPTEDSTWTQRFQIEEKGFLENNPEWLILQGESSLTQRTEIDLAANAELFFIEAIAAGRVAHGESFEFRRFRNRLTLRYDSKLAALEKHSISPASSSRDHWRDALKEPHPFYLSILLASPKLQDDSPLWQSIHELQSPRLVIGSSKLAAGPCWSVKILSQNPVDARKALAAVRDRYFQAIGRTASALRR